MTRRTHDRRLRLRPCAETTNLFLYLLAVLAPRYGIGIWGVVVMSNHYHLGCTDHEGRLPAFLQALDALFARALNVLQDRHDALWSGGKPHVAMVADEGAVFEKVGYMAANPVAARLVEHGRDWPGVRSTAQDYAKPTPCKRPTFFFDAEGNMPEEAALTFEVPPLCAHLERGHFIRAVCDAVAEAEETARTNNSGKPYLGEARCRGVDPMAEPSAPEAGGKRKAGIVIATDDASRREVDEALEAFLEAYSIARNEYLEGNRDTRWPRGTWFRVVIDRCPCAAPGPAG